MPSNAPLYAQEAKARASSPHSVGTNTGHVSWHFVDAKNMVTGRLAPKIANLLIGKHKPTYNPRHDDGDYVVVVNASETKLTGRKNRDKVYYWHTGYPGGLKTTSPRKLLEKDEGAEILRKAVSGMLPKNKLRKHRERRLILFPDADTHELFDDVIPEKKPLWYHAEFSGSEIEEVDADDGEWEDLETLPRADIEAWLDANPDDKDFQDIYNALHGTTGEADSPSDKKET
eukprot:g302.t1